MSSWEFKSSRRKCANERKRRDHDNTLHNYIKRLQSDSRNIMKQQDNCQNSDLRESENEHECYCWSSRNLHESQRMLSLRLRESEVKEYAIIRIEVYENQENRHECYCQFSRDLMLMTQRIKQCSRVIERKSREHNYAQRTLMSCITWRHHSSACDRSQFNNENVVIKRKDNCQNSDLWKSKLFRE